jgi:thiamine-phosphate pyrophosphorylase
MRLDPRSLSVYVVTSSRGARRSGHLEIAAAAIAGRATAVQLRAPELTDGSLLPLAHEIAEACRAAGVLFVVNDRVEVAAAVGAGAHVGQDDGPERARGLLGPDAVLGLSVGTVGDVAVAERAGADYLGVTVFSTSTKPDARPIGLDGLSRIVAATSIPVVGIGGIHAANARDVLAAGAAGVAVISAVADADDPISAVASLVDAVKRAGATR